MLRFAMRQLVAWFAPITLLSALFGCAVARQGDGGDFGTGSGSTGAASGSSSSGPDATASGSSSSGIPGNGNDSSVTFIVNTPEAASCPSTCDVLGANCGVVFDKFCGGTVQCGECETGVCGAPMAGNDAGTPNVCGTGNGTSADGSPTCIPQTCADLGITCGPAGDGCGGAIDCGNSCVLPQTCGGAKPGVCGCTGVCSQIADCSEAAGPTTLTGVVMDPGAVNPLYNALVYIPNDPTDPALTSPLADGVTCDVCGASAAGTPLVTAQSKTDGSFVLSGVPVGNNITLVVQLGRWRRLFQVNIPTACGANVATGTGSEVDGGAPIANGILTMPKNKGEGDIPRVAVVTGDADAMECVFWKMGVDAAEFTNPGGTGRIQLMQGSGHGTGPAPDRSTVCACASGGAACTTQGAACTGTGGAASTCQCQNFGGGAIIDANTPTEMVLFEDNGTAAVNPVNGYDMTVLSCQSWPWGAANQPSLNHYPELVTYANSGGRIFASHFSSSYLQTATAALGPNAFAGTANWGGGGVANAGAKASFVDVNPLDNPKGAAFAAWLGNPVTALSATPAWMTMPADAPTVTIAQVKRDVVSLIPPSQQWMFDSPQDDDQTFVPLFYSFNTPIGAASTAQCGRGLFSDFHVTPNNMAADGKTGTHNLVFPAECGSRTMTAQEKVLEFILFDLGSCVQPYKPICTPTTCAAQNLQCGAAGDGCGGALDCGPCPAGEACVRGMCTINATCTPTTCSAQGIQCGPAGDGCGNAIDCGPCPTGEICGYSGPGKCGGAR
jgi:hypothetical protein